MGQIQQGSEQARALESRIVPRASLSHDRSMKFRSLYDRYAESTFAFFQRRVGDPDRAADLNQDLYLRVFRSMKTYEGRCSWRTWIFVIARATLAEHRNQRWNRISDRTVVLDAEAARQELGFGDGADESATTVLFHRRLRICLRRLDDMARAVVLGHYFSGVTLRELTERLELTNTSGARAVLISAQRKLRRCLEQWSRK